METYNTLSEAIQALKKQGYSLDFNLKETCLECSEGKHKLTHEDFVVDKFFRFDTDEDPADQSILYAISSVKHDVKGLLVNGFGRFSDPVANELLEKLKVH
ncbi:MAG: phosphoribosylpyrophosphate synthetase [Bacteroidetes bacterium]|nr:phosphoribosylpyrophosphate synthetase [Bacteroidota bacterium]